MVRKANAETLNLIKASEGCKLKIYLDCAGLKSIGIGHCLTKNEILSGIYANGITDEEALQILAVDLESACSAVERLVTVNLTDNQFGALVSFVFNVGQGSLSGSTLLKYLNNGDYKGAADEFLVWDKAGGKVEQGLITRRSNERTLFLKADANA